MKTYFAPAGDYILYVSAPLFAAIFGWVVFSTYEVYLNFTYILVASSIFIALWLFILLRRIFYHLVIDEEGSIFEKGFLTRSRVISAKEIVAIRRAEPYNSTGGYSRAFSRRQFFLVTQDQHTREFPSLAISPSIISALIELNPNIHLDQSLAELLPQEECEKLGLRTTFVEKIWFYIRRGAVISLLLILIFIVWHWFYTML